MRPTHSCGCPRSWSVPFCIHEIGDRSEARASTSGHPLARMTQPSLRRLVVWACVAASSTLIAATGPKSPVNTGGGELAIKGYDVVAYTSGVAAPGKAQFTHRWNGAVWQFATARNRDRFAKTPEKYAPQ